MRFKTCGLGCGRDIRLRGHRARSPRLDSGREIRGLAGVVRETAWAERAADPERHFGDRGARDAVDARVLGGSREGSARAVSTSAGAGSQPAPQARECGAPPPPALPSLSPPPLSNQMARFSGSHHVHVSAAQGSGFSADTADS